MEAAIAVRLDVEVLAWLRGYSTEVKRTLYEQVLSRERRRNIPTRERKAVAPIGRAPHTVCCLRPAAVQTALVPAGIAPRGGKPQRQYE
jgi:hypothetical protein